ncbi:MAG: amidohydrolase [Phycisphaerales bacterium]|nr:amidohydrolase [Phycisphaerales bacterium]MCB9857404.1 amidohydrolase [Phycisphaerales bacterium]
MDIEAAIHRAVPVATRLRHEIHAHPELGYEEVETARRVHACLSSLPNIEIQTGIAKTGIVALLNSDRAGPTVALRAELDALPVQELSDLPHKSTIPNRMHACGHDGHTACLVGAAIALSELAAEIPGCVKFIWQPAEEGLAGGALMIDAGILDHPKVDAAFAMHGWPYMPLGKIGVRAGATMASADFFDMTIRGVGAHAAYPHRSVDPIYVGAQIVNAVQSIASRGVDPLDAVVVSVTQFQAGTANNIIPATARLTGTIRTLREPVRASALGRFEAIARQTAAAHGASVDLEMGRGYPVLINDASCAGFVNDVTRDVFGEAAVQGDMPACMGGEDFAFFAQRVPAAFWRLGVATQPPESQPTLHQATYDFPDAAIPTAIRMHCEIAVRFLRGRAG